MSDGRWIMRGRVFRTYTFATWALANSGLENIHGNPVAGWVAGYTERVFSVHGDSRVWDAGHSTRVFDVSEKH